MARTHVVMDQEILEQIDRRVGARGRSRFLEQAAREKLARLELEEALQATSGMVGEKDYEQRPFWTVLGFSPRPGKRPCGPVGTRPNSPDGATQSSSPMPWSPARPASTERSLSPTTSPTSRCVISESCSQVRSDQDGFIVGSGVRFAQAAGSNLQPPGLRSCRPGARRSVAVGQTTSGISLLPR